MAQTIAAGLLAISGYLAIVAAIAWDAFKAGKHRTTLRVINSGPA